METGEGGGGCCAKRADHVARHLQAQSTWQIQALAVEDLTSPFCCHVRARNIPMRAIQHRTVLHSYARNIAVLYAHNIAVSGNNRREVRHRHSFQRHRSRCSRLSLLQSHRHCVHLVAAAWDPAWLAPSPRSGLSRGLLPMRPASRACLSLLVRNLGFDEPWKNSWRYGV